LLESLAEGPVPEPEGPAELERSRRISQAVDERLELLARARTRSRRRAIVAGVGAAFAAGVAAAWMVLKASSTERDVATLTAAAPVEIHRSGASSAVEESRGHLGPDDEVHTPEGTTATAVLTSGANVEVEPDSTVRFDARSESPESTGEALTLSQGTVVLQVPKLGPHRTLSVLTPDARVTVRGTRFSVSVLGGSDRGETRVRVTEGSVWVDHAGKEDVLAAGQSWSSRPEIARATEGPSAGPAAESSPALAAGPDTSTGMAHRDSIAGVKPRRTDTEGDPAGSAGPRSREPNAPLAGTSTLAAENELYRRAVAAARMGDDAHAVGLLDTFLSRFPGSPLAQNAAVERFRALVRAGRHDGAMRAANQYLSAYPNGFAREEALRVAERNGSDREP
jgi:ferric-dicitrate binding protein FerR (iron transport regulator)